VPFCCLLAHYAPSYADVSCSRLTLLRACLALPPLAAPLGGRKEEGERATQCRHIFSPPLPNAFLRCLPAACHPAWACVCPCSCVKEEGRLPAASLCMPACLPAGGRYSACLGGGGAAVSPVPAQFSSDASVCHLHYLNSAEEIYYIPLLKGRKKEEERCQRITLLPCLLAARHCCWHLEGVCCLQEEGPGVYARTSAVACACARLTGSPAGTLLNVLRVPFD